MAVKVKRMVPRNKALDMIPLFSEMRTLAMNQKGYNSGETLRNIDDPDEFLVISIWNSSNDWKNWLKKKERKEIQAKMDALLGGETEYKFFHHGLTE